MGFKISCEIPAHSNLHCARKRQKKEMPKQKTAIKTPELTWRRTVPRLSQFMAA